MPVARSLSGAGGWQQISSQKATGTVKIFAAMPPLEARKCLFRIAVAMRRKWRGRGKVKISFLDVRRAHMNPKLKESEKVYVDLPEAFEQEGKCART